MQLQSSLFHLTTFWNGSVFPGASRGVASVAATVLTIEDKNHLVVQQDYFEE
jgi:hypothetical protein